MRTHSFRATLFGTALALCAAASAQDVSALLDGAGHPPTRATTDLAGYKAVKIGVSGGSAVSELMSSPFMMIGMAMGSGGRGQDGMEPMMRLMSAIDLSWTKGETTSLGGLNYLVTYKLEMGPAEMILAEETFDPSKLALKLQLVRLDAISTITPRPDVTPESYAALFASPAREESEDEEHSMADRTATPDQAAAARNMRHLALAAIMFAGDYDDNLPYVHSTYGIFQELIPYTTSKDVFKTRNPNARILFNMSLSGANFVELDNPTGTPMFYESAPWPDGSRNVAFADGHVQRVSAEEWDALQPYLRLKLKRRGKPFPPHHGENFFN